MPHAATWGGRSSAHVVTLHRRVQLDIDQTHNPSLPDALDNVGGWFMRQPWAELVAVSASGRGLCVWVRTADPYCRDLAERVIDYVETLAHDAGHTLQCDRVNSMSPVALRFALNRVMHYNPDAKKMCNNLLEH